MKNLRIISRSLLAIAVAMGLGVLSLSAMENNNVVTQGRDLERHAKQIILDACDTRCKKEKLDEKGLKGIYDGLTPDLKERYFKAIRVRSFFSSLGLHSRVPMQEIKNAVNKVFFLDCVYLASKKVDLIKKSGLAEKELGEAVDTFNDELYNMLKQLLDEKK